MVTAEQIEVWIQAGWQGEALEIFIEGDGRHFEAVLVSDEFLNKSRIQRQRLVYAALGDKMGGQIHALSFQTWTSQEYKERGL